MKLPVISLLVCGACVLLSSSRMLGQAEPTVKAASSMTGYVGYSHVDTDYGASKGGFVGAFDFTPHPRRMFLQSSLEIRASRTFSNAGVRETVYGGGAKLAHARGRYSIYGDMLLGRGVIDYLGSTGTKLGSDNSTVYTFGGGITYRVSRRFGVFGEYQSSHWNLGNNDTLTPSLATVGLTVHYH